MWIGRHPEKVGATGSLPCEPGTISKERETEMKRVALAGLAALVACEEAKPPRACGTVSDQEMNVGIAVTVSVCFEDPEGGEVTLAAVSSQESVAETFVSASRVTVKGVSPGTAVVTVTATDEDGLTGDLEFGVTVPNRPPAVLDTIQDAVLAPGETREWDLRRYFEEPDGQELTYSAAPSDANIVAVTVTGSMLEATGTAEGTAVVTVTATDAMGLSATQEFGVEVTTRRNLDGSWEGLASEDGEELMSFTFTLTETDGRISGTVEAYHFGFDANGSGRVMGRLNGQEVVLDFRLIGDNGMDSEFSYEGEWEGGDRIDGDLQKAGFSEVWPLPLERDDE